MPPNKNACRVKMQQGLKAEIQTSVYHLNPRDHQGEFLDRLWCLSSTIKLERYAASELWAYMPFDYSVRLVIQPRQPDATCCLIVILKFRSF